jgi:large subunit ribosomal protein L29
MKIDEARNLSGEELDVELERLHEQVFSLRAQAVTEKLQDPSQLRKARRDIARLMTVKRERELNINQGQA